MKTNNQNIHVVYISYDGMTDPLGQSQVIPYLIGLSKSGFNFSLISFEKEQRFTEHKDLIEGILKENYITWFPQRYHAKPPVLSTVWDIYKMFQVVKQIHQNNPIKILHCRSYISAMAGLYFKKKWGTKFIFDMRGFWADERVDGNIWNLKNPVFNTIYKYFKRKEKSFIENADAIVSLTHNAKDEIHSWKNIINNPVYIQVIPCCADFNHFNPSTIEQQKLTVLKTSLQIANDDFILTYVGSIGTWYMLPQMLDFFNLLCAKYSTAKFLIVTADNPQQVYEEAARKNISNDKLIIRKSSRAEMPYYISLSNFSVFFIKPAYSKKASSPTKLAEILGMGINVICNSNVGDVEKIITEGEVGIVLNRFDESSYQKAVEEIAGYPKKSKEEIINYANHYASLKNGVEKYEHVYLKVIG